MLLIKLYGSRVAFQVVALSDTWCYRAGARSASSVASAL